jgi:uroporphyrinogen decarboxylase
VSSLSKRERVQRVFCRKPVDRLPTQVTYTAAMGRQLAKMLGVQPSQLEDRLDNHLLRVDLSYPRRESLDGRIAYDWWGVGWDTTQEGYFLAHAPLEGLKPLDSIAWPDPAEPGLLDEARDRMAGDSAQRFVAPNFGFCLFERAWSLVGFTELLTALALRPRYVSELLDRIAQIQVRLARRFVDLGVDGGYFGDDYGAQSNLLFSPRTWRALFKPRLAQMFAVFRESNLPVILHSDGQIQAILQDLVDIGVTVLNPVQPEVIDHAWLKATFGDRLAFYGGVSTQSILPRGDPAQVAQAVKDCSTRLASGGTGLLLAPSHRMMGDIPAANVAALLRSFGISGTPLAVVASHSMNCSS